MFSLLCFTNVDLNFTGVSLREMKRSQSPGDERPCGSLILLNRQETERKKETETLQIVEK